MGPVFGYGEDALTYWAITSRLGDILQELDDKSIPSDAVVIYRPSFGRKGSAGADKPTAQWSPEFGEFDAIVGTRQAIYLVESKWDSSSEMRHGVVTISDVQLRRHNIMRWYIETWRTCQSRDWQTFVAQQGVAFQDKYVGNRIAPPGTRLGHNLEFILNVLGECGKQVRDVLLFLGQAASVKPSRVEPSHFDLVVFEYHPLIPSGYFHLSVLGADYVGHGS